MRLKLKRFIKSRLDILISKKACKYPFILAARVSQIYLRAYYNERNWNAETNGEFWLLRKIIQSLDSSRNFIIIDVGANKGDWAIYAHQHSKMLEKNVIVECFEPNPAVFDMLFERAINEGDAKIKPHHAAIGSASGFLQLFVTHDHSMSSFALRPGIKVETVVEVPVLTGKDVLAMLSEDSIGLLKVDTEGYESTVIKSLEPLIALHRPVIQFEYGKTYIPHRALIKDIYDVLTPYGYRIGRLHPSWVNFSDYSIDKIEDFRYGNFAAIPDDKLGILN